MSDMPRVIHAVKKMVDQDNGFSIEYRDWWPIRIHEAATSYTRTDLVDEKDKRITALEDALREAFHLLDDLAKLEVGHSDGSDMYTCTMSADEYLERVNGLHEKATALLGDSI